MSHVLFITRKLRGKGGMQQYTQDLLVAFQEITGGNTVLLGPRRLLQYPSFPFLALWRGVHAARRGYRVHLGDMALSPLAVAIKFFIPGAKITATASGLDVLRTLPLYQWMLRRSLPSLDRVICISHATADAVYARGVLRGKIVVIPCGIWMGADECVRRGKRGEPRLLTVGRLVPRKGVAWFLSEVLPLLLQEYPHLHYTVVGTGPHEKLIKKVVHEKGLEDAVTLAGAVSDERRNQLLKESDCFVVPNVPREADMEGFGIVCIEASSRGVPVVAARLEGLTEAVQEGETGLFFQTGNAKECVQCIRSVLTQPPDPLSVARCTREHYSWPQLLPRLRDALLS
ncbi:MAG TPA: glycosyltransferase family 4 protein [Candidatus Peribacteraceae bacterium]|nr:glycosyltransferase family 4 protein [Candidatus Peribacteraceae bacterium]